MAVYKRSYKPFEGTQTPSWSRFLILPRFAFQDVFASRITTAFFVFCFVPTLGAALLIYTRYNANFLQTFDLNIDDFLAIDATFFFYFLRAQALFLGFVLTVLVGPGLVSGDLSNNALPLYLCRPFSRAEYVLGKMSVLMILLSLITWVPGLVLIGLQTSLAGWEWFSANWILVPAYFISSWVAILLFSLLSLTVSAWVRWRPIAAATIFGFFIVAAGFGQIINAMLRVSFGDLLNLSDMVVSVWAALFAIDNPTTTSSWAAGLTLISFAVLCLLALTRRLKAYEVVS